MDKDRRAAFLILKETEDRQAFSNLEINAFERRGELGDAAFVRSLVYGVLRNALLLDYNMRRYLKSPGLKTSERCLLRMGFYQLVFMNSVPDHAAVSETVELASAFIKGKQGFINAVLRSFVRDGKELRYPPEDDLQEYLSVRYSCHTSITGLWLKAYGRERTEDMLAASLAAPPLHTRVSKFTGREVIQGAASMKAVETLAPAAGETLLDLCAAPGGKSCYAAELMDNKGRVMAFDLYEKRAALISRQAEDLGIKIISAAPADACIFRPELAESADCVLADVPCSGLGTIGKKPEIKLKGLSPELPELYKIQAQILSNAGRYVKPGGRLLYSTCTVNPRENALQTEKFLKENPEFSSVSEEQLFPDAFGGDGFYISLFRRNNAQHRI